MNIRGSYLVFVTGTMMLLCRGTTGVSDAAATCDRQPPSKTGSKSPDNGYKILVSGNPTHYVPGQTYTGEFWLLSDHTCSEFPMRMC